AKAIITSHRAYYKLRVCQEAIWEAFRIFFDRVPNTEEYMAWVLACQHENLCMDDLARNFSSSQEHLDMVATRILAVVSFPLRAEDVSVRYAVLFNGDTELSDQPEGYHTANVEMQGERTAPKLKSIIVQALKHELFLPLDLNSLSFNDGM
uniref:Uncharacterized protein n=1 Tax=Neogobius melanostomus TaxID=47308 RepID=A0A8C6U153_9GOBI